MHLYVLFIHRKESYAGEYAPEALVVVDEYARDDNPEWFQEACITELEKCGDDVARHGVLTIDVPQDQITSMLYPENKALKGRIIGKVAEKVLPVGWAMDFEYDDTDSPVVVICTGPNGQYVRLHKTDGLHAYYDALPGRSELIDRISGVAKGVAYEMGWIDSPEDIPMRPRDGS